jgi:hypothetical protein
MKTSIYNRVKVLAAILLIALGAIVETRAGKAYCRSEFRTYFQGLGAGETRVNPVERFLFSVLLTHAKADAPAARTPRVPAKQL